MPEDHFGEDVAAIYDESSRAMFAPEVLRETVDVLAELARDGAALEFAIGTGRVALPLADRGVPVSGIESSTAMVNRLRTKDGAHRVKVTIGDMATTRVGDDFRLVYLVFNSIGNLTTQDEQVACFVNAAAHLQLTSATTATSTSSPNRPSHTILSLINPEYGKQGCRSGMCGRRSST
jgi:SAM-dependent methyltransferase